LTDLLRGHFDIFAPWFIYNWVYDPEELEDEGIELPIPPNMTLSQIFLEKRGKNLDSLQRRVLEANIRRPYTFYEVKSCRPGEGVQLEDLILGDVIDVFEEKGSENLNPGDILFARTVTIDHVTMLDGCGKHKIPSDFKENILEFRDRILQAYDTLTWEVLEEYDMEIRDFYFYVCDDFLEPLVSQNTDGDPLLFHTLYYEIDDPGEAFEKLRPLAKGISKQKLLDEALYDRNGNLVEIEFPWLRKGFKGNALFDDTVLGNIYIKKDILIIDVNSAKRAEKIKNEITKRLKGHARLRDTDIQTLEEVRGGEEDDWDEDLEDELDDEALLKRPEIQEGLVKILNGKWEEWLDEEVPFFGGKIPREMVKTKEGRDRVRDFLKFMEMEVRKDEVMGAAHLRGIQKVRKALGLPVDGEEE